MLKIVLVAQIKIIPLTTFFILCSTDFRTEDL